MKTKKIIISRDIKTLNRIKERGLFSDDPQWLFNAMMVLEKRDYVYNGLKCSLDQVEEFLVTEDIPYYRIITND